MHIISIKTHPEYEKKIINYFKKVWSTEASEKVYEDAIKNSKHEGLPNWYLLLNDKEVIGCVGLITNDFISRMDLYPWLAALYIEPNYRGSNYSALLIDQVKKDAKAYGYQELYLCTEHQGYYEKYGFKYLAHGYHPWGESSKIYKIIL
ncbi:GNAT family N-acetyltransferase [Tenericutes bacterium MO-XQ]|nr:GNAT family N-acetyltransferase [Tenericutes bacterium MO-XQ]